MAFFPSGRALFALVMVHRHLANETADANERTLLLDMARRMEVSGLVRVLRNATCDQRLSVHLRKQA